MGGGLMQLVAYGAQDIYLTGNPQITFFKVVYRRHTNFAIECIQQSVDGSSSLVASSEGTGTVIVSRNGDLVHKVYVTMDARGVTSGDKIIKDVSVMIGGSTIDKHTREFMQVWNELTIPDSKAAGFKAMTGCCGISGTATTTDNNLTLTQIPLLFWFCRNPGLALPIIALQYSEVKFVFTWGAGSDVGSGDAQTGTVKVWCDYIFLDTDERRRFAQVSHEYLIEQLQYQDESSSQSIYTLNLNHPVKELIWTDDPDSNPITTQEIKIILNGQDRMKAQKKEYFQLRQPMDYHTAIPGQNIPCVSTPRLLATPIALTSEIEVDNVLLHGDTLSTAGNISVTAAGVVKFRTATNPGKLYVGDVLSLSYPSSTEEQTSHIVTVTTVTQQWEDSSTVCQVTVNQTGAKLANSKAGDGAGYIIARSHNNLCRTSSLTRTINCYSFALEPEEHQPSGSCNFSRIDNSKIELSDNSATIKTIYAINYNVLRIMSGSGGLAYSS